MYNKTSKGLSDRLGGGVWCAGRDTIASRPCAAPCPACPRSALLFFVLCSRPAVAVAVAAPAGLFRAVVALLLWRLALLLAPVLANRIAIACMPSLLLASGHRANEFQRRRRREDREMRNGDDGPRPRRGRTMSAPRARRRSGPVAVVRVVLLLLLLLLQIDASAAAGAGGGSDDPYVVLGVRRTASNEEIQRAYRQRAKETHREIV